VPVEVLLLLGIAALAAISGVLIGRRVAPGIDRLAERMEDDVADE
jgi:hypothetical protein